MPGSGPNGEWLATDAAFWARVTQPIVGWKLWFAGGSTAHAAHRQPWQWAPLWERTSRDGVQVLMVYHPGGYRTIVKGRDEYTLPGVSTSKLGLMLDFDRYDEIRRAAVADTWRP
jgi:hypothetical protein